MGRYFEFYYTGGEFELFSTSHLIVILLIALLNIIIFVKKNSLKNGMCERRFRYAIAMILLFQEISLNVWYIYTGKWSIVYSLPLHLCGASVILCSIMLFKSNYALFEIAYFWGVGGAVQAILTPDLGSYGYPHYRFYQFFISHGLIVTACLFMIFVKGFKPNKKSILRAFGSANIYMIFIGFFNYLTSANYLFICEKPLGQSIMDFLGPWPYYIGFLEIIALITFSLLYLPFALQKFKWKSKIVVGNRNKVEI